MRVLVVSNIEWADDNAFGNTISNWFSNMPDIEFASIYRRHSKPNNNICNKYYCITPLSIIRNYFTPKFIGYEFSIDKTLKNKLEYINNKNKFEKKIIHCFNHLGLKILPFIENFFFNTKKWENDKFIDFVKRFKPEIVFSFITSSKAGFQIVKAIKEIVPTCKQIGFIADDVYGVLKSYSKEKTIEEHIHIADKVYGCSDILVENYSKMFNVKIDTLYKGCTFDKDIIPKNNSIKTIVYAGNLHYGRLKTLAELAKSIAEHNKKNDTKVELNIYTNELLNNEQKKSLNIHGASKLCGTRPYSEIKEIMDEADITLHAESFKDENIKVVRYSFSTKIIDCLQSNSVLLAIGPANIASIDFAKKVPGAFVVTDLSDIALILKQITSEDLYKRSLEMRKFAIENFDIKNIQNKILSDFEELLNN